MGLRAAARMQERAVKCSVSEEFGTGKGMRDVGFLLMLNNKRVCVTKISSALFIVLKRCRPWL